MREFVTPDVQRDFDDWVELLTLAFLNDPLMVWFTPDPATREHRLRGFFAAELRWFHAHSTVDVLQDDQGQLLGIGIWRAPDAPEPSWWSRLRYTWAVRRAVGRRYLGRVREMSAKFNTRMPRTAHWYLAYVATSPITSGQGVGKDLISRGLSRGDAAGIGVYLESSNAGNDAYYHKFGFEDVDVVRFSDGPSCSTMWRKPAL